ncbi:hypothetical protein M4I32_00335 [Microbacterium sp. LRZ72]|uniref:hypothetical protein n=1 Tax=Microbacterium sp. LRZ72 TaxID=2942481 RepID=UPI0029A06F24|nr:hypothetical protein [Microbacterium sp. LRZ72]MDX2375251.1 hypothetical protein [Microbacterium sp. LRZ72]
MTQSIPLRERIRQGGGLYQWINASLIRVAGPAAVGPYDDPASAPDRPRECPVCHAAMDAHVIDRTGPKTLLTCPPRTRDRR